MGYIIGLIIVVLLVPLIVMALTRRTHAVGGVQSPDRGLTPEKPAADEPTPRPGPGVDPKIPPS